MTDLISLAEKLHIWKFGIDGRIGEFLLKTEVISALEIEEKRRKEAIRILSHIIERLEESKAHHPMETREIRFNPSRGGDFGSRELAIVVWEYIDQAVLESRKALALLEEKK